MSTPMWTEDLHGIMPPQPRRSDQPFYCRIKILAGWTLSDRITLLKKHRAEYCHLEGTWRESEYTSLKNISTKTKFEKCTVKAISRKPQTVSLLCPFIDDLKAGFVNEVVLVIVGP